jgi:hypothetical protein
VESISLRWWQLKPIIITFVANYIKCINYAILKLSTTTVTLRNPITNSHHHYHQHQPEQVYHGQRSPARSDDSALFALSDAESFYLFETQTLFLVTALLHLLWQAYSRHTNPERLVVMIYKIIGNERFLFIFHLVMLIRFCVKLSPLTYLSCGNNAVRI